MSGMIKGDMVIACLCEKMGWDYYTYLDQPVWFVELLIQKLEIDNKKQAQANRK
jgi:hypothetical protein